MLPALITRPITRIVDIFSPPKVEDTVEQPQRTSLDDQVPTPSPEMPRHPSQGHADASGDNSTLVHNRTNGRHEERPRPAPRTGAHRPWLSREDHLQSRLRIQTARLRSLENTHDQLASEHESLKRDHRQLLETHQIALTNLHGTRMTCKEQQQETDALREKLRDSSVLLDVRNQEMKVAKTFLSREDLFSASDVFQSVRDLNSEIMQTATYFAETLPLKRLRTSSAEEVPEGPYKSIFVTLVLPQGPEGVDVGSLELALQGFLTFYTSAVVNTWGFSSTSSWCDKLYSKVCETEDRTVASNWRVLTRRTIAHMDSNYDDLPRKIVNNMIKQLAELLSSCGVGGTVDNADVIRKQGAEKLEALFTAAQKLNKMIGENFVSEDLMVSVIRGGTMFDGERMENAYARAGSKPGQRAVVCTTDLGLYERKKAKGVGKMLIKPKVVLRDS